MTSAPVRDVGSLLNFVGNRNLTATGGTNQMEGFGDVMSKAQSDSGKTADKSQSAAGQEVSKQPVRETTGRKEPVKETKPIEKEVETADVSEQQSSQIEEAGEQMVQKIADELGLSTEDVERAMEELGLSLFSLFDPASLSQLVVQLSGQQDSTVLLTDESLFASFQGILQSAGELQQNLQQELKITPEELKTMMQKLQADAGVVETMATMETVDVEQVTEPVETEIELPEDGMNAQKQEVKAESQEKAPVITVEVESGSQTVKLETDEKGNPIKVQEVVPSETEQVEVKPQTEGQEQKDSEKGDEHSKNEFHTGNQLLDSLLQNKGQTQEVTFEQTTSVFGTETQEIMDQIMDYMKIQLKPGMDQLEMQLHPESLGTVHIQLSSKGGEVTAQFQVQNEEVKAVLESQIVELKESLKDQGVKVEAVQVTVENRGFESNLWQGQGREENAPSREGKRTTRRININDLDELFADEASEEEQLAVQMMEANGNTVDYTA